MAAKTYYIVLRTGFAAAMSWVTEGLPGVFADERQEGDVELPDIYTSLEFAKLMADRARLEENHRRGLTIDLEGKIGDKARLWVITIGGVVVAKATDVCLICKHYRGCDYDGEHRCGVLS